MTLIVGAVLSVHWSAGRAGEIRMQEKKGNTSGQEITNGGRQTGNSR
jgi:hypothetical protein